MFKRESCLVTFWKLHVIIFEGHVLRCSRELAWRSPRHWFACSSFLDLRSESWVVIELELFRLSSSFALSDCMYSYLFLFLVWTPSVTYSLLKATKQWLGTCFYGLFGYLRWMNKGDLFFVGWDLTENSIYWSFFCFCFVILICLFISHLKATNNYLLC